MATRLVRISKTAFEEVRKRMQAEGYDVTDAQHLGMSDIVLAPPEVKLRAWRITGAGATVLVRSANRSRAVYVAQRAAQEVNQAVRYLDFRARRAPEYDDNEGMTEDMIYEGDDSQSR